MSACSTISVSAREGYKLWAATYDDDPNPLLALEERGLYPMLPDLRCKDALDIGCGTGRLLNALLGRGARSVVGVDSSAEMLDRAATKPLVRNRLVLADCVALPFRAQVADVIVCSFTVGHLLNTQALARELARVARPHADVFVTDMHPEAQAQGWRCAFRCKNKTVEIRSFAHTPEELRKSFNSEGFKRVQSCDLRLGEPERRIFTRARKGHIFATACSTPAVLVLQFKLI
jgi:SAM-dependent methyltransferase